MPMEQWHYLTRNMAREKVITQTFMNNVICDKTRRVLEYKYLVKKGKWLSWQGSIYNKLGQLYQVSG